MVTTVSSDLKRVVHLTINAHLLELAESYTEDLCATMEALLAEFVARQEQIHSVCRKTAEACANDWNAVHAAVGSFADQYSTL